MLPNAAGSFHGRRFLKTPGFMCAHARACALDAPGDAPRRQRLFAVAPVAAAPGGAARGFGGGHAWGGGHVLGAQ